MSGARVGSPPTDEVLELCRRVLGDGDPARQAAAAASSRPTSDRIEMLAFAARECRARAEVRNGGAAAESGGDAVSRDAVSRDALAADPPAADAPAGLRSSVARELAEATLRLPERQREALALRELLRLSYDQIAHVMDVDVTVVAPLLAESRLRLRAERRGTALGPATVRCPEHDRALRILASRQDSEPVSHEDDEWLLAHLADCLQCGTAHAAMLEASVCYRAWP